MQNFADFGDEGLTFAELFCSLGHPKEVLTAIERNRELPVLRREDEDTALALNECPQKANQCHDNPTAGHQRILVSKRN